METDTELFERHTRVNQLGCFLGMKIVVPLMERTGGGSIVQHIICCRPPRISRRDSYSATKWALRGMTNAAASSRRSDAAEKLGGLHGLVNNAGIYQPRTFCDEQPSLGCALSNPLLESHLDGRTLRHHQVRMQSGGPLARAHRQ